MLDRAVFARCIHCLEKEKDAPFILRVELILKLGQGDNAVGQRFLRPRLIFFLGVIEGITGIDILEPEILAFGYAKWIHHIVRAFD